MLTGKKSEGDGSMQMNDRKVKILQAIIKDYIDTAEPVGSRTIARKYNLGVSSATIRNEMRRPGGNGTYRPAPRLGRKDTVG